MTYTVVDMKISSSTYEEIREKLFAAGYDHAVSSEGLDMTHIRLVPDWGDDNGD